MPLTQKPVGKISLPADFGISDRVRVWAVDKGYDRLEERLEDFVGTSRAKGYIYADWDQAFMNAIRKNWAKLEGKPAVAVSRLTPAGQKTAAALQRWAHDAEANDGAR